MDRVTRGVVAGIAIQVGANPADIRATKGLKLIIKDESEPGDLQGLISAIEAAAKKHRFKLIILNSDSSTKTPPS